ncbi:hypothetical protein F511_34909 [Dorcoceras hygrometricum]|uniref:Uncharacterized protein n=1 Tax=Dorcoceras hygrometricum TaxID=472368 RepID=A0A2Z7BXG3_9LAMI|nr:hypothetical protein F511_34909 [Dorcoceras hygrometricum]
MTCTSWESGLLCDVVWRSPNLFLRRVQIWSRLRSELISALLFTERYLLRLPTVEDSDWSKIGSIEFPLLRRFHYDHFRRIGLSWKKNAKKLQCVVVRLLTDLVLLFR